MGLHHPFEYLKHKLWPKITLNYVRVGGVPHIIGKILNRATTFLDTSSQLEVFTRNYGPPIVGSPNFENFETPKLGVLGQNDIWMDPSWLIIDNIIRGKVVASLKSRSW
jgi:hypothetical protein